MDKQMKALLLIVMIKTTLYGLDMAFTLNCPFHSQWNIRAKDVCNISDRYLCLYDANKMLNVEACRIEPQLDAPGFKIQIVGSLEGVQCDTDRYQPFKFWTNGSRICKYDKSLCNGEGQVPFSSGTNKKDRACRCDYTEGYDFVARPKNVCYCIPSEEDCSCFIRQCPSGFVLSPDFNCSAVEELLASSKCPLRTINGEKTNTPISSKDVKSDIQDYYTVHLRKRSHLLKTCVSILGFLFIGLCFLYFYFIDNYTCERKNWKDDLKKFVQTRASQDIFYTVKENQCVLLTSSFGSGKTAIAIYIADKLEKEGYAILFVSSPEEISKRFRPNQRQFFLLDDLFESTCPNICDLTNHWSDINTIFIKNSYVKVLVTCRTYIYEMNVEYFADVRNSVSLVHKDLMSEDLQLSLDERRNIYKSYFESTIPESISSKNLLMYHFYPSICSFYDKSTFVKHLGHPDNIISEKVNIMLKHRDISFLVLPVLVVLNNEVDKKMFSGTVQNETKDFFQDIFEESGFEQYPTNHVLLRSFTSFNGEFTKCNGDVFSFLSTELFDSVASCIGGLFLKSILKYSSSKFITDKLQLYSSIDENNCPYSIKVPQDMEDCFYRRLTLDMNCHHFVDILSNLMFENEVNRKQFIKYLEKRVKSERLVDATTGSTVFHIVSALGYPDFLKHFLEFDDREKINTRNLKGRTSLHLASKHGKIQSVICLLQQKVVFEKIDKLDKKKSTALHYACKAGDTDIVKCLIESKASTNTANVKGRTPLHIACMKGSLDTVKCLADNKANINESGENGKTPLHYACESRLSNIVNTLIIKNAIINKLDDQGSTPLHIACTYGYEEIVKLLLDNKPLTNIKNIQGQTAVNVAIQKGFQNISKLIIDSS